MVAKVLKNALLYKMPNYLKNLHKMKKRKVVMMKNKIAIAIKATSK